MSPHLTVMRLRDGQPLWADAYLTHRIVMAATDSEKALWAMPTRDLLVVQHNTFDHSRLPYGLVVEHTTAPVQTRHEAGVFVNVSLLGCPVKSTSRWKVGPDGQRTRRTTPTIKVLRTDDDRAAWFTRKLGGALDRIAVTSEAMPASVGRKEARLITHARVAFSAVAVVRDPDMLEQHIRDGVGKGRAFGLGLLVVRS
jgi:CRISPR-associated protein Cas6/Cse3/CasE subtype I-E